MLKIVNFTYKIRKKTILNNLNLVINRGEIVALIGNNGSGKTSLLRVISNAYPNAKIRNDFKNILFLPENFALPGNMEVYSFLKTIAIINDQLLTIKTLMQILEIPNLKIKNLSKGNRQKVVILFGILNKVELILFDEILDGLDQKTIGKIIKFLKQTNKTIIFVTHYISSFKRQGIRIIKMENGNLETNENFS